MDGVLERRNDQHTRRIVPFPVSIGATIKIVGDHVSGANQCQKTERNCAKISVRSHSPLLALVHAALRISAVIQRLVSASSQPKSCCLRVAPFCEFECARAVFIGERGDG